MSKGIGGHQRAYEGATDEWLTPPHILKALGEFDLDPCSPIVRPWPTAAKHFTIDDNGLTQDWGDPKLIRVWLNPPYGQDTGRWTSKLAQHGRGMALIFARTETADFQEHCWKRATAMLFIRGRLHFHHGSPFVDKRGRKFNVGDRASYNGGAPSVLIAYGLYDATLLMQSMIPGHFVLLRHA